MAGHSKWANIQHRKGAQDQRRAKIFTRLIRELTVAARRGGADAESNPRLRLAMDRARAQNMSRETLERAVKRGAGGLDGADYQEVHYEGYGPGGAAVMVDCLTDNRNRTVAEIRHAFVKFGGNLGAGGSVSYLFNQVGQLTFPPGVDEGRLVEAGIEAGAEDVVTLPDGSVEVLTDPADFVRIRDRLEAMGLATELAQVTRRAATSVALEPAAASTMVKLLEHLEELDDVQNVYTNAEIPDDILSGL
jgi:YebC/PmpR family DNA-binding regulatory protein